MQTSRQVPPALLLLLLQWRLLKVVSKQQGLTMSAAVACKGEGRTRVSPPLHMGPMQTMLPPMPQRATTVQLGTRAGKRKHDRVTCHMLE
jgi:hypothetical protein